MTLVGHSELRFKPAWSPVGVLHVQIMPVSRPHFCPQHARFWRVFEHGCLHAHAVRTPNTRHKNGGGEKDAAKLEASQSFMLSALPNAGDTGKGLMGVLGLLSSALAGAVEVKKRPMPKKSPALLLLLPPRLKKPRLQLPRPFAGQLFQLEIRW